MSLSRRRLLQGATALAVSAAAPVRWVAAAAAAPATSTATASWFSRSSYTPLVGTAFAVKPTAGATAFLTLNAIGNLAPPPSKQRPPPADGRFSLAFTSATSFVQGTYPIHHDALGDSTLFVVPVGAKGPLQSYEVIVSRLT